VIKRAYPEQRVLYCYPDRAGNAFRPSNGTEGMMFDAVFCDVCVKECVAGNYCKIRGLVMAFNYDDPEYPNEWVFGDDGWPMCSSYKRRGGPRRRRPCPKTPDMFGPHPVKHGTVKGIVNEALNTAPAKPEKIKKNETVA